MTNDCDDVVGGGQIAVRLSLKPCTSSCRCTGHSHVSGGREKISAMRTRDETSTPFIFPAFVANMALWLAVSAAKLMTSASVPRPDGPCGPFKFFVAFVNYRADVWSYSALLQIELVAKRIFCPVKNGTAHSINWQSGRISSARMVNGG